MQNGCGFWRPFPIPFVATHTFFAKILASSAPSTSPGLYNDHCSILGSAICNHFRTFHDMWRNDTGQLVYALIIVREYLSDLVTAPFLTLDPLTAPERLTTLRAESQQQADFQNPANEVPTSILIFNAEQKNVFNEIVAAILPCVPCSNSIDTLRSSIASPSQS